VYAAHGWHAALVVGMLLPAWIHEATWQVAARQSAQTTRRIKICFNQPLS